MRFYEAAAGKQIEHELIPLLLSPALLHLMMEAPISITCLSRQLGFLHRMSLSCILKVLLMEKLRASEVSRAMGCNFLPNLKNRVCLQQTSTSAARSTSIR
jgi:hypothetical protein